LTKAGRRKIRVGFVVGKNFDPIRQGTQDRLYPKRLRVLNNTGPSASGWGGMFHIDVSVALKMARLYSDLVEVDIITGPEVCASRLRRNHVNFNFFFDVVIAEYNAGRARANCVKGLFKNPDCRMWPSFDYYDWVCTKSRYMKQCRRAGIPIIDTIFVDGKLHPEKLLKQIQAKGWDRFFIKNGSYVCFGNGAVHGRTKDFFEDPSLLHQFVKENPGIQSFLVQPYTLKPNGNVFDEVRNFFIDGCWAYSVYTDGTDDDAVFEQPAGAVKDVCRGLAERAYKEVLKVAKWHGRKTAPLMCRIDVGVVPRKSEPAGVHAFLNEIECEVSTWLPRYCPFDLSTAVAEASARKTAELVQGLLRAGVRMKDAPALQELAKDLEVRAAPREA